MATLDILKQNLREKALTTSSPIYKDFIIPQLSFLLAPLFNSRTHTSVLEIGPGPRSALRYLPSYLRRKLCSASDTKSPLPCLGSRPDIYRRPFVLNSNIKDSGGSNDGISSFDIILFCHSIYRMKPKRSFIEQALEMLVKEPEDGIVVVFHRAGVIRVANDNDILDCFSPFIAGFLMKDTELDRAVRVKWREICRTLGRCEETSPDHLLFSSPNIMVAFTRHATTLEELTAHILLLEGVKVVKNQQARLYHPALTLRPLQIRHIQQCVEWALRHKVKLTVIGGGHSGHCLWPNVVSIDMGAFDQIYILAAGGEGDESASDSEPLVVTEAGCKTGNVVRETLAAGLMVPLGARLSVGAGLWLQGGIGHLSRRHGLACDAIVGAVVVSVYSGQVLCVGRVPSQYWPAGAVRPDNEADLLWAIKGAGPNFGIVNAYLFWDNEQLHLGLPFGIPTPAHTVLGPEDNSEIVNGVGLFETEMYISRMHGGHSGGKTSSFKRCLFLKHIEATNVTKILVAAIETRPSQLCYLYLLPGGGAVGDVPNDATAFGSTVKWVYKVAEDLLPLSTGAYGADLGPDPRDAALAAKAFRPNLPRLVRLKSNLDPRNVLAYACPLPKAPAEHKLVILITGESCAGKDYYADIWVSMLTARAHKSLKARAVSISDTVKQEYAAATGADLRRLLWDRAYKEQHRPELTKFFQSQVLKRPQLPQEHFLNAIYSAAGVDMLLITGMRDEAPVLTLSHLVPDCRLLEVRVKATEETRRVRRGCQASSDNYDNNADNKTNGKSDLAASGHCPSLVFNNDTTGNTMAKQFAENYLLPFFHEDLDRLASMVRPISDFPSPGVEFRHVLGISQQPGGLALCTSLLQTHFTSDWAKINAVVCCEAGGFVYASALAARVDIPLALIREASKLPPPTISVIKSPSHISSSAYNDATKRIEMSRDLISRGASVVVVDDVLATGETLCAVLQLLSKVGIGVEDTSIIVVAEFPVYRGRELLRQHGFGGIKVQSLLVFGGA
ncbi:uncharacterized protein NECHADRAFT_98112 [Fusarium vanettenii 77-13-4]|uniref:FAD-binding PCMH-type domain-containing protein n=1 Tax=Fusarium vanettenii (strain ATCC MYA-4622 / CBS 123669 / FGSC 9596 / NRRL 45880 / 77-13-4) TaxID=660122 RepID=C7ZME9_FUSV7|nr:uncharacterized protein NECHADRAFT_98112 [Fusarium vanettenii 77-13-4]EEU34844.1 hypothetical protein NECHADRAFT_98112 [Fusarium vanettenii 77-13-4]